MSPFLGILSNGHMSDFLRVGYTPNYNKVIHWSFGSHQFSTKPKSINHRRNPYTESPPYYRLKPSFWTHLGGLNHQIFLKPSASHATSNGHLWSTVAGQSQQGSHPQAAATVHDGALPHGPRRAIWEALPGQAFAPQKAGLQTFQKDESSDEVPTWVRMVLLIPIVFIVTC